MPFDCATHCLTPEKLRLWKVWSALGIKVTRTAFFKSQETHDDWLWAPVTHPGLSACQPCREWAYGSTKNEASDFCEKCLSTGNILTSEMKPSPPIPTG